MLAKITAIIEIADQLDEQDTCSYIRNLLQESAGKVVMVTVELTKEKEIDHE